MHKLKYLFFTALYIMSAVIIYEMRVEIGVVLGLVENLLDGLASVLKLEWAILFYILCFLFLKLLFYSIYMVGIFLVWFLLVIKMNWLSLLFLPLKRLVVYTITRFSIIDRFKDKSKNTVTTLYKDMLDKFQSWPVGLRLYSFPAVTLTTISLFLFVLLINAIKLLVANKLGDKIVEISLRLFIMKFPTTRDKIQPLLDTIDKGVSKFESRHKQQT